MDTSGTMAGLGLIGTGLQVGGTIGAGAAANKAGVFEAAQLRQREGVDIAEGQQRARIEAEKGNIVRGQQQAIAASSGGGVATPTIAAIMGETQQRADTNMKTALWTGQYRATQDENAARAAIAKGKSAYTGSILQGIGQGLSGAARFLPRTGLFGAPKMPTLDDSTDN